jgi:RimJ/RimL family protein N-acetyltransferase
MSWSTGTAPTSPTNNLRSRALAERLGFRVEEVLRQAERFAEGDYRGLVLYSMLASERPEDE